MIATVTPLAGEAPHRAVLRLGDAVFACVLGARGATAAHGADKEEGDRRTPATTMPLRRVLFRADRIRPPPVTAVGRAPLAPDDGWCDDAADARYNRPVRLPWAGRAEALWRDDGVYDVVAPLGWNDRPPRPGRGSAIFLHVAPPGGAPTDGCVALALPDLLAVLRSGLTGVAVQPHPAR